MVGSELLDVEANRVSACLTELGCFVPPLTALGIRAHIYFSSDGVLDPDFLGIQG